MKKIICLAALIVLGACSSDDDKSIKEDFGGNIPAEEKLLESFNFGNSLPMEFQYNDDKTVKRLNFAGIYIFDFKYSGGYITSVNAIGEGISAVVEFSHNANGIISGLSVNGEEQIVEYDHANNSYLYYEQGDNERHTVFINAYGDLERYRLEEENYDDENYLFVYNEDEDKKGPMANSNNIHVYLAMIFPDLAIYMSFLGHKPVDIVSVGGGGTFQCVNTFYNDGFVEQTNFIVSAQDEEQPPSAGVYRYTKI